MLSGYRALLLGASLVCAPLSKALPLVVWSEDSVSAFDVMITGSLSESGETWGGAVQSPSGLWSVGTFDNAPAATVAWFGVEYLSDHNTFNGQFLPTGEDFFTFEAFGASYQGVGSQFGGSAEILFSENIFWTGFASTFFTVGSNPNDYTGQDQTDHTDYTTWQYAVRISASGPALAVPDSGSTLLLLAASIMALGLARRMGFSHSR